MNLHTIALNNLRRRKARLAFLVMGLLVGIATVVTLISLSEALTMEAEHKIDSFGANILVTPVSDDLSLSYGGVNVAGVTVEPDPIRMDELERIRTIPNARNIAAVAPKIVGAVEISDRRVVMMGVDPEIEFNLKKWWTIDGRALTETDELVAGSAVAEALQLNLGDEVEIAGQMFTVTGILQPTGSQDDRLLIAALPRVQSLLGREGVVSLVEIAALCADCPIEDLVQQLSAALPATRVTALQQVVKSRMHALEQFRIFSLSIAAVVVFIGALIVFVTMMGSVNERTREIGIFRALGFRRTHVMNLIMTEAIAVSFIAGALGYLAGMAATWATLPFLAEEHPHLAFNPLLLGGALLLAVAVGSLASIYPALHASRMEPTEALRAL